MPLLIRIKKILKIWQRLSFIPSYICRNYRGDASDKRKRKTISKIVSVTR